MAVSWDEPLLLLCHKQLSFEELVTDLEPGALAPGSFFSQDPAV